MSKNAVFERLAGPSDTLPESPLWHESTDSLFWVDHATKTLNCSRFPNREFTNIPLETRGNLRFVKSGSADRLMIGSERGLYELRLSDRQLISLEDSLPIHSGTCINDGAVGPNGQIVLAISDVDESRPIGGFFLRQPDGWACIQDQVTIANGPVFSMDGDLIYTSDTLNKQIYSYDMIDKKLAPYLDLRKFAGYPDGLFISPAGLLYISFWEGARVDVYRGRKLIDSIKKTPGMNATCSCLIGDGGDGKMAVTVCDHQPGFAGVVFLTCSGDR